MTNFNIYQVMFYNNHLKTNEEYFSTLQGAKNFIIKKLKQYNINISAEEFLVESERFPNYYSGKFMKDIHQEYSAFINELEVIV